MAQSQDDNGSHDGNGKQEDRQKLHQRDVDPLRRHVVDTPRGRPGDRQMMEDEPDDDGDDDERDEKDSSEDSDDEESGSQSKSGSSKDKKKESDDSKDSGEDEQKKKGNPRGKLLLLIAAIVLLLLLLVVGLPWYLHQRHFEATDDAFIDAHWEKVGPRVAGRVTHVYFSDNDLVTAGQTVARIDPGTFEADVHQQEAAVAQAEGSVAQSKAQEVVANAGVGQAQANLDRAKVTRDNADVELKRYRALSPEAVSRQKLDDLTATLRSDEAELSSAQQNLESAKAQVIKAQSDVASSEASVKSARAKLENARLQLGYTEVIAATTGHVTQLGVRDGDYVSVGQLLMNIVPEHVWITANYKETQLTDMRVGQEVDFTVDAYPDRTLHGKVQSIQAGTGQWFSLLPPENATGNYVKVVQRVPVKITIDDNNSDTYRLMSPGMSVYPKVRVR